MKTNFTSFLSLKIGVLIFGISALSSIAEGQISRDTFRSTPIISLQDALDQGLLIDNKKAVMDDALERRLKSKDFFETMRQLAEPSTISFFGTGKAWYTNRKYQKKLFLLDGDIQTPIALGGKRWTMRKFIFFGEKTLVNTLHIIPQFKVRIFKDDPQFRDTSSAVRTPSYLPGITWFISSKKFWRHQISGSGKRTYIKGNFCGLRLFHHSNGQDGPEFNADGTINFYNGNFGENLVPEFIIGGIKESERQTFFLFRWKLFNRLPNAKSAPVGTNKRLFYWKFSFEPHLKQLFNIPMTNAAFDQLNLYGRYRFNLQLGWSVLPRYRDLIKSDDCYVQVSDWDERELFRLILNLNFISDFNYSTGDVNQQTKVGLGLDKRTNLYATLFWRIPGTPNASAFLQFGYWGSDNYNIYFQQSLFQLRGGISMAFYKYPTTPDFKLEN